MVIIHTKHKYTVVMERKWTSWLIYGTSLPKYTNNKKYDSNGKVRYFRLMMISRWVTTTPSQSPKPEWVSWTHKIPCIAKTLEITDKCNYILHTLEYTQQATIIRCLTVLTSRQCFITDTDQYRQYHNSVTYHNHPVLIQRAKTHFQQSHHFCLISNTSALESSIWQAHAVL